MRFFCYILQKKSVCVCECYMSMCNCKKNIFAKTKMIDTLKIDEDIKHFSSIFESEFEITYCLLSKKLININNVIDFCKNINDIDSAATCIATINSISKIIINFNNDNDYKKLNKIKFYLYCSEIMFPQILNIFKEKFNKNKLEQLVSSKILNCPRTRTIKKLQLRKNSIA